MIQLEFSTCLYTLLITGNSESCPTTDDKNINDISLSEADRKSYEKTFSSIIVPYTSLAIKEEIGQGELGNFLREHLFSWTVLV